MRFDTLTDWLTWQESLHPSAIDLGLDRVREVAARLGVVGLSCPVVTVAGTNGKGSSIAMLEAMNRAAGYRVGSYTSPHLLRYNERLRIDGREVDDRAWCEAFDRVDQARHVPGSDAISLTYFEFGTLAALDLLARQTLDLVLLEVGLGGRLDAVNLLDADVALISSIGIDHIDWLGPDRDSIGREKAGIARRGRPVVCADPDPPQGFLQAVEAIGARLYRQDSHWQVRQQGDVWNWSVDGRLRTALPLPRLRGRAQQRNAAAVLMVAELLHESLPLDQQAVRRGLAEAALAGRFQVVPGPVDVVLDVAHNAEATAELARMLAVGRTGQRPLPTLAVAGMLNDKQRIDVLEPLLGVVDQWYLADLPGPRGCGARQLADALQTLKVNTPVHQAPSVAAALSGAQAGAAPFTDPADGVSPRIVVFGSFLTVAAAMKELGVTATG